MTELIADSTQYSYLYTQYSALSTMHSFVEDCHVLLWLTIAVI